MPCYDAVTILQDWLYEVDAAQAAFDANHGYLDWPSAPMPWPMTGTPAPAQYCGCHGAT